MQPSSAADRDMKRLVGKVEVVKGEGFGG